MTINYGELGSITTKFFFPYLVDNIFGSNPLLARLKKKSYTKVSGGTELVVPLLYATTTAAGWYNGSTDTLTTTANDQIDSAKFDWAYAYAKITISRKDELINGGKEAIINFVKAKVQVAEKSLADTLGTGLYNLGTTSNAIIGLRLAVDSTGTYGNISRTTYSWWAANEDANTVLSIPVVQGLVGDCTVGSDKPTLIATTQNIYDDFIGLLQPQQRFQDESTANAGFTNVLYAGIPMIVDSHCPASHMFAINEDYLHFFVFGDEDFRWEPFQKPTNQAMATAGIYWAGQMAVSNCRMMGKCNAIA